MWVCLTLFKTYKTAWLHVFLSRQATSLRSQISTVNLVSTMLLLPIKNDLNKAGIVLNKNIPLKLEYITFERRNNKLADVS